MPLKRHKTLTNRAFHNSQHAGTVTIRGSQSVLHVELAHFFNASFQLSIFRSFVIRIYSIYTLPRQ